jgi:hypothetical protein
MKELLGVIKDAARRGMGMAQLGGQVAEEQQEAEPPKNDVVMLDAEMKNLAERSGTTATTNIWGQKASSYSTTKSSLFGPSQSARAPPSVIFATSESALSGNSGNNVQASHHSFVVWGMLTITPLPGVLFESSQNDNSDITRGSSSL